ncbi:MAG: hypothetical protein R3C61_21255 [Bacteroidia bacterium]
MTDAETIFKELMSEEVGVWYVSDEYGSKMMIKIPSNAIRSLIKGCKIDLTFGKDEKGGKSYFHTGARIFDDAISHLNISNPNRHYREYKAIQNILNDECIIVEFYNEIVVCVATTELKIKIQERNRLLDFMGDINELYVGDYNSEISSSLDAFDFTLDASNPNKGTYKIPVVSVDCQLENWQNVNVTFVGISEAHELNVSNLDEGGTFEKQIWASLETLFNFGLYLNPEIVESNKKRELTDILAFYEYGVFLFETKALGVLNLDKEQTIERKVSNIQKQIRKAIGQLVGANKKVEKNLQIVSFNGKEIHFNRNIIPHCIVLVSELLPFREWTDLELEMMQTMVEENIYLHVLDFREFMNFVKAAGGNKENFDYYLMHRAEKFAEVKSIHIRSKFIK